jgi:hypothetical protein
LWLPWLCLYNRDGHVAAVDLNNLCRRQMPLGGPRRWSRVPQNRSTPSPPNRTNSWDRPRLPGAAGAHRAHTLASCAVPEARRWCVSLELRRTCHPASGRPSIRFTADGRKGRDLRHRGDGRTDDRAGRARDHSRRQRHGTGHRPDGKLLLVADRGRRVVTVLDTASGKVLADPRRGIGNFCFNRRR